MTLLDSYVPVFKHVLRMTGDPDAFCEYDDSRKTCIACLEQAVQSADEQDTTASEKEAACTAVIAWLDETILRSGLQWRQRWQSELLQRKYLNITTAGERFYTLLAQLNPSEKQARNVFLFCLQQGFRGQYSAPEDQDALLIVIAEQRQYCLPEEWQTWPNDLGITPVTHLITPALSLRRHPLLSLLAAVLLLYGVLYFYLHYYVS